MPQGVATLDFGAFPGSSHATVNVTGQGAIVAGSLVEAWIRPVATVDHSADEHMVETLKVFAANIVAGTGFTIHGFNTSQINQPLDKGPPTNALLQVQATRLSTDPQPYRGGKGTRIYGRWTIAWAWNT